MDPELDWIQTYLAERGPAARGHRYPNEFRLRTARWAKRQRDSGATQSAVESQIGIPWRPLKRWVSRLKHVEDKPTSLVPVRLERVLQTAVRNELALISPSGWRLEGLTWEQAIEAMGRLS